MFQVTLMVHDSEVSCLRFLMKENGVLLPEKKPCCQLIPATSTHGAAQHQLRIKNEVARLRFSKREALVDVEPRKDYLHAHLMTCTLGCILGCIITV